MSLKVFEGVPPDGVIVSTALMGGDAGDDDLVRWDDDLCRRFMDAARTA